MKKAEIENRQVVEGLAEWLALLNLDAYEPAVAAWASDMGAVVLEEIVENISDLRMAVPFKRLETCPEQRRN
eukprot:916321-Amphidinium_carterae.2